MTTNAEYIAGLILDHPNNEFTRDDIVSNKTDQDKLSPYFTYAERAGLIERIKRGHYRKTSMVEMPLPAIIKKVTEALSRTSSRNKQHGKPTAATEEQIEVDVYEVLDQLPVEAIFDVLAAKINLLSSKAAPLAHEVTALRDQITLRDGKIQSLQLDLMRMEEKQRTLNAENQRLTALMTNAKKERLVLAKPVHTQTGTAVFHEGDRKTIKVFRKPGGGQ